MKARAAGGMATIKEVVEEVRDDPRTME